jgi:hypothetical protein
MSGERRVLSGGADRTRSRRSRLQSLGLVLVLVAGALGAAGLVDRAGAATRTVTVTPASGLGTQVVHVEWSGFDPAVAGALNSVNVFQCKANPKVVAKDCFTATPYPNSADGNGVIAAPTQSDGTGSVDIEVRGATLLPELNCSATNPCSIVAVQITGRTPPADRLPAESAVASLSFAPSVADCPALSRFDVTLEGEASAADQLYRWAAAKCAGTDALALDFTETSSNEGRVSFLAHHVDAAVTSLGAPAGELAGAPAPAYAPLDLTAVAIVFNMKDPTTGRQITDLTLSPRLVARIISNSDLFGIFSDPELQQLNPGVHWPTNSLSEPLLRSEGNADTWLTTAWLAGDADAKAFLHGADRFGVPVNPKWKDVAYPTSVFENREGSSTYVPRDGRREVSERVFHGVKPTASSANSTDYIGFVGVLDLPTATRFNLPIAKLVNASGHAVPPTKESILASYAAMKVQPDGTRVADFSSTDADAYPLTKVDYAMLDRAQPTQAKADAVARFLRYTADLGQEVLLPGYVALPAQLADESKAVAGSLTVAPTAPPPAPGTTPYDPSGTGSGYDGSSSSSRAGSRAAATARAATAAAAAKGGVGGGFTPVASYGDAGSSYGLVIALLIGLVAVGAGVSGLVVPKARAARATRRASDPGPEGEA